MYNFICTCVNIFIHRTVQVDLTNNVFAFSGEMLAVASYSIVYSVLCTSSSSSSSCSTRTTSLSHSTHNDRKSTNLNQNSRTMFMISCLTSSHTHIRSTYVHVHSCTYRPFSVYFDYYSCVKLGSCENDRLSSVERERENEGQCMIKVNPKK